MPIVPYKITCTMVKCVSIYIYSGTSLLLTLSDLYLVLITEVPSIQRSFKHITVLHWAKSAILIIGVSAIQRSFNILEYYTGHRMVFSL